MSSIAYISDEKMLDFHRKSGNRSINFWRLSRKKFGRFHPGDLIFFLDKSQLHPETKEKGLVAYGRLKEIDSLSLKTMWERYETKNGYPHYEGLVEAIQSSNNDDEIKGRIQSLVLEDLIFFHSPVFLSDFGFSLNRNLESFTYLEQSGHDLAIDILTQVLNDGIDPWFAMLNHLSIDEIKADIREQKLREVLESIDLSYNETQYAISKGKSCVKAIAYEMNEKIKVIVPISNIKKQRYVLYGVSAVIQKLSEEPCIIEAWIKNDFSLYEEELKEMNIVPVSI